MLTLKVSTTTQLVLFLALIFCIHCDESLNAVASGNQQKLIALPLTGREVTDYDENLNCLGKCKSDENLHKNCYDAAPGCDGIRALRIPKSNLPPFYVFCKLNYDAADGHAWTIIQRREDGSVDFNRNWTDYKNGFGDVHGEYWIGLERIFQMTKDQPHELWISLVDYNNKERNGRYEDFSVSNEQEKYALHIGKYTGDSGDSLGRHNGKPFETYERDASCAEPYKSGWWFVSCAFCNLNGVYRSYSNRKMYDGVNWLHWKDESLKYVHMAIRPITPGASRAPTEDDSKKLNLEPIRPSY